MHQQEKATTELLEALSAMRYTPPAPENLRRLKDDLKLTSEQMAELFGLAGGQQWRKYTGGQNPREMSGQMLFFAAARLELDDVSIDRVLERMRAIGARVSLEATAEVERP
jgi:hypothetical protein